MGMRTKTDRVSVCLKYTGYSIIFKWIGGNEMLVASEYGEWKHHRKTGKMTINGFIDIEWIAGVT